MSELQISLETMHAQDRDAVERLHARAFGPGRFSRTAFRIREQAGQAESLAFVARVGSLLVAAVQLTPIRIGTHPAFMLGPLTVDPPFEGKGIGGALIERCAIAARAVKRDLIILVGDEPYYKRFGYKRVPMGKISLPGPVDPMRVLALELEPGALANVSGELRGSA
ncbi:MAG: GNAT family N-acetyltransferase [Rhizobiales bacterium PAR1]|nr:MAG: GNAT family N-acetyltransferase [Rhizobiales bacterium PAR1]